MRDYLSPAKRYVSRVIPHPGALGTFVAKRKALTFAITASFVVITTIGFIAMRGTMQDSTIYQDSVNKSSDSSVDATVTSSTLSTPSTPASDSSHQSNNSSSSSTSSSTNKPSVTVNNQPIDVPANGTVHKTVRSDNGTTKVDISVNSNSSTSSTTSTSSNLNVNTNTSSYSTKTESHSQ
ncbi:MAG: hypothetical protein JWN75_311 [Candidatus Saccharibacteria bacterium]|nr:hypothetical protein [Candidatus Saccharibacteria bacterium]